VLPCPIMRYRLHPYLLRRAASGPSGSFCELALVRLMRGRRRYVSRAFIAVTFRRNHTRQENSQDAIAVLAAQHFEDHVFAGFSLVTVAR